MFSASLVQRPDKVAENILIVQDEIQEKPLFSNIKRGNFRKKTFVIFRPLILKDTFGLIQK